MTSETNDYSFIENIRDKDNWIKSREKKAAKIRKILSESTCPLSDKRILDLGCSIGLISTELSKDALFVVGCDVDVKTLKIALKNSKIDRNIFFLAADGLNLPFKENSFDIAILNQVLDYVSDPAYTVSEVRGVLEDNGLCYLSATNKLFAEPAKKIKLIHTLFFKGESYFGTPYFLHQIKRFFVGFDFTDITADIIRRPKDYNVDGIPTVISHLFRILPERLTRMLVYFTPSWVILLKKI